MDIRIRRLEADWAAVQRALHEHPRIKIAGTAGNPPQRYHLLYRVKGLEEKLDGAIVEKDEHLVEISLLRSYPRQPPVCRMLTPVFHPNIAPHVICIGDQWSAGESLLELIFRIGEMIAYQSYNIKSPLNGVAAKWVEDNQARLPVDASSLLPPGMAETPGVGAQAAATDSCSRCGRVARATDLWSCSAGHKVCPRCRTVCMACGKPVCSACGLQMCVVCAQNYCTSCMARCGCCGQPACAAHRARCQQCQAETCQQCLITCRFCGNRVCRRHLASCALCGTTACATHIAECYLCRRAGCPACATQCAVCAQKICRDHAQVCFQCKQIVCATHFDGQQARCSACQGKAAAPLPGLPAAEEPIVFRCASCQVKLSARRQHAGMQIVCPKCRTACVIPSSPPAA